MLKNEYPHVRLIESKCNAGFAKANNKGIEISRGDYLFLVNSDIHILPGCIAKIADYMETHKNIGILGPKILNADRSLQLSCRRFPSVASSVARAFALDNIIPSFTFNDHSITGSVDVLSGCFWAIRRTALKEVGELDETFMMYSEDVDWCKRFADAGWQPTYFTEAKAVHYGGGSSQNTPLICFLALQDAAATYWRKHYGSKGIFFFNTISVVHYMLRWLGGAATSIIKRKKALPTMERSTAAIKLALNIGNARLDIRNHFS